MNTAVSIVMFFSVLVPTKTWYSPSEAINVNVKAPEGVELVNLVLADFTNRAIELKQEVQITGEKMIDVRTLLPEGTTSGTYLLFAVPKDAARKDFAGTPLVITIRQDKRQGAPPGVMAIKVEPLCYVQMTTDKGPMTMVFYYDAEFNTRQHQAGVISMARSLDPNEAGGAMPRSDFANSAGSQFFICLDYENTKQLDRRYTAFGKVVDGMETVKAIAASKIADPQTGRPEMPPKILKAEVRPVTAKDNPYLKVFAEVAGPTLIPQ
jgi:cyclophilin family peptidyl-prolyl cis-trans isomerase